MKVSDTNTETDPAEVALALIEETKDKLLYTADYLWLQRYGQRADGRSFLKRTIMSLQTSIDMLGLYGSIYNSINTATDGDSSIAFTFESEDPFEQSIVVDADIVANVNTVQQQLRDTLNPLFDTLIEEYQLQDLTPVELDIR